MVRSRFRVTREQDLPVEWWDRIVILWSQQGAGSGDAMMDVFIRLSGLPREQTRLASYDGDLLTIKDVFCGVYTGGWVYGVAQSSSDSPVHFVGVVEASAVMQSLLPGVEVLDDRFFMTTTHVVKHSQAVLLPVGKTISDVREAYVRFGNMHVFFEDGTSNVTPVVVGAGELVNSKQPVAYESFPMNSIGQVDYNSPIDKFCWSQDSDD